ncbi:MAG: hypothetical protein ACYCQM_01205 [Acidithiobacillus sp.]
MMRTVEHLPLRPGAGAHEHLHQPVRQTAVQVLHHEFDFPVIYYGDRVVQVSLSAENAKEICFPAANPYGARRIIVIFAAGS